MQVILYLRIYPKDKRALKALVRTGYHLSATYSKHASVGGGDMVYLQSRC